MTRNLEEKEAFLVKNSTHRYHNQCCPMVSSAPANHPGQFVIEKCLLPEAVWVRGRGVNLSKYFLSQSLTSINPFKEASGLHLSHRGPSRHWAKRRRQRFLFHHCTDLQDTQTLRIHGFTMEWEKNETAPALNNEHWLVFWIGANKATFKTPQFVTARAK